MATLHRASLLLAFAVGVGGCQRTYYRALETVGIEKRELLTSRVESARESQEDAKEQFRALIVEMEAAIEQAEEFIDELRA